MSSGMVPVASVVVMLDMLDESRCEEFVFLAWTLCAEADVLLWLSLGGLEYLAV